MVEGIGHVHQHRAVHFLQQIYGEDKFSVSRAHSHVLGVPEDFVRTAEHQRGERVLSVLARRFAETVGLPIQPSDVV